MTEVTLKGTMQSTGMYNTTKHIRSSTVRIDTDAAIACSAMGDWRQMNRWTESLFRALLAAVQ